jgi:hypothetical protein
MHIFWVLYFEIVEGLTLLCDHFSHVVLSTVKSFIVSYNCLSVIGLTDRCVINALPTLNVT